MKKRLIVDKDGKITYDEKEIVRSEIDDSFLENIFRSALKNEIEFKIDETEPISYIFKRIQEETHPKSNFHIDIDNLRNQLKENQEEKIEIEKAEDEDDLPF